MSYTFFENLTQWVEMQKRAKNAFQSIYDKVKNGDRLDLILATRAAFKHMIKTLQAFDSWLRDPLIISHMPREYLEEVWDVTYKLLLTLLDLDIKHTSSFRDYLEKLQKEGKINPVVALDTGGARERREREEITLSM